MTNVMQVSLLGGFLLVGCSAGSSSDQRVDVGEANDLGVVTFETEHAVEAGNDVFTLHAFSADEDEIASVRLTTGQIADLHRLLPGTSESGSEIVVSVRGNDVRELTRETQLFTVKSANTAMQAFLELPVVSSTLRREANMIVRSSAKLERSEKQFSYCDASQLNVEPIAGQCCADYAGGYTQSQIFIKDTYSVVYKTGGGEPCTSQSGGSCSGASCYYGPNGFARPSLTGSYAPNHPMVFDYFGSCEVFSYRPFEGPGAEYMNVYGTFPNGQGCPGGSSGGQGDWDI